MGKTSTNSNNLQFETLYGYQHMSSRTRDLPQLQGVPRVYWKSDESMQWCGICMRKFGLLRRKHHCRACGDICCRKCLIFSLVDVPAIGVDLSYTCVKCIRKHTKNDQLNDFAYLAAAHDTQMLADPHSISLDSSLKIHLDKKIDNFDAFSTASSNHTTSTTSVIDPGISNLTAKANSISHATSALIPCEPPHTYDREYNVIVNQYPNEKLNFVCSLLGDYLDCKGGAIVLFEEHHIWVVAHIGIRSTALYSETFLSLCHRVRTRAESFSLSHRKASNNLQKDSSLKRQATFQFYSAAPIFKSYEKQTTNMVGCIIALDTVCREIHEADKVKRTLWDLSQQVTKILKDEKSILRLYTSGDYKMFLSIIV